VEGDEECLRGELVRKIGADPPVQVAVDGQKVSMKEDAELVRIASRRRDDVRIRHGSQWLLLPHSLLSEVLQTVPLSERI
jgi:hypothetical protein